MKLSLNSELTFQSIETRTSQKTNNSYSLICLRDFEAFEEYNFFKLDDLQVPNLKQGDSVYCEFEVRRRGFDNQLNLISISKLGS